MLGNEAADKAALELGSMSQRRTHRNSLERWLIQMRRPQHAQSRILNRVAWEAAELGGSPCTLSAGGPFRMHRNVAGKLRCVAQIDNSGASHVWWCGVLKLSSPCRYISHVLPWLLDGTACVPGQKVALDFWSIFRNARKLRGFCSRM